ncbi:hypothetical protein ACVWZT_004363 [Pseudomonas sp. TE21394]
MKPRFSLTFTGLLLCSAALPAAASTPMTDFQRFTSYPFMERSYREAKKDNWAEVERLTRHVLDRVPNNDEARSLLVEALAHQRRYKEAEALAAQLGDSPVHANALLELRLSWIEQDPPPASEVERWLASSAGAQRVHLWQAYSLSLAKSGGAARALDWLNHLPPQEDGQVLRLAKANFAEQLRNWKETIEQLQPLAAQRPIRRSRQPGSPGHGQPGHRRRPEPAGPALAASAAGRATEPAGTAPAAVGTGSPGAGRRAGPTPEQRTATPLPGNRRLAVAP